MEMAPPQTMSQSFDSGSENFYFSKCPQVIVIDLEWSFEKPPQVEFLVEQYLKDWT